MRVRVTHGIGDLANDLAQIPVSFATRAPQVVEWNAQRGNTIARRFAREKAGPHGKDWYKRLTSEMTGPLTAEYGPEGIPKTDFVGVGFRSGTNLDLPNSADIVGPDFADDTGDMAEGLFRSAGFR
ncbi:hypothetical protein [Nocardioides sp. YIM 152315]|uniref:hypothetical protein n=1 Tax=Nocardioides sp. YIM 152315 TaxID=3031760 RepID=UPI0023D9889B|nr:hypothetical protein [Nocardioides sp. YIM 152315]MDF1603396.1 hypothetical protein [Nocardioides sp. YIM 152315]